MYFLSRNRGYLFANTELALISALFVPTAADAYDVEAMSRTYTHSCGYFSNQVSEIEIVLRNYDLVSGAKVEAIFGYEGYTAQPGNRPRIPFEWARERVQTVEASGPGTWTFKHLAYVHERSSPSFVEALNITFRITHADGAVSYENGSGSPWGFYRVILAPSGGCTGANYPLPEFETSEIQAVERY